MAKYGHGSTLFTVKVISNPQEVFETVPVVYKEIEKQKPYVSPISTVEAFTVEFELITVREQEPPILQNIFIKDNIAKSIEREFRQNLNTLKGKN